MAAGNYVPGWLEHYLTFLAEDAPLRMPTLSLRLTPPAGAGKSNVMTELIVRAERRGRCAGCGERFDRDLAESLGSPAPGVICSPECFGEAIPV